MFVETFNLKETKNVAIFFSFKYWILAAAGDSQFEKANKREIVWNAWSVCEFSVNGRCNGLHGIFDDLHIIVRHCWILWIFPEKKVSNKVKKNFQKK